MSEPRQPQPGHPGEDSPGREQSAGTEGTDMGDPEATGEAGGSLAEEDSGTAATRPQQPAEAAGGDEEPSDVDPVEREIEAGGAVSEVSWPG